MFETQKRLMECQLTLPQAVHVLVEEELEVRDHWAKIAKEKKLALFSFSSASAFLTSLCFWNAQTTFYLDQDMHGVRGQGVELAKIVRAILPTAKIYLITAYPKSLFIEELHDGVLNDVFGKYPEPFDRPEYTRLEREYQTQFWRISK
jgi:FixJ family two-component response regulator